MRLVQEQCATRTIPEVVRFYGKWKKYVYSIFKMLYDLKPFFYELVRDYERKTIESITQVHILGFVQNLPHLLKMTTMNPSLMCRCSPPATVLHVGEGIPRFGGKLQRDFSQRCYATAVALIGENMPI